MSFGAWSSILRTLILPQDAGDGARIVLDGDTGQILIYNDANELVASLEGDASVARFRLWDGSTIVGELASTTGPFDLALRLAVAGDTNARWYVRSDGGQFWGDGTAGQDVNLYRSAAGVLKTDGSLNVAVALTGDGTGITRGVRKGGDTTRVNTVTMDVDPDLQLPVVAGTYEYEFDVKWTAHSACDIKFDIGQNPAGSTIGRWLAVTNGTGGVWTVVQNGASTALAQDGTTGTPFGVLIKGTAVFTQAGTFGLRWAQNILDAVNSASVHTGSKMRLTRFA